MRIIFFGTPNFAAEILKDLIQKKADIVAVVSQPDRAKGRSKKPVPTPVKETSTSFLPDVPLFQPEKASSKEFIHQIENLKADLFVIVAYGQILKQELLDAALQDAINVHASLLPKYRGAAPIQRALMAGDAKTGITIMEVVRQMDAGDMLLQVPIDIPENMTFGELEERLCEVGKKALWETIEAFEKKNVKRTPQDSAEVTYAPKLQPEERQVSWGRPAQEISNLIRALSPQPGAWTWMEQNAERKRLKILGARVLHEARKPGELFLEDGKVIVGCTENSLELLQVQPEGKKILTASEWIRGCKEKITIVAI